MFNKADSLDSNAVVHPFLFLLLLFSALDFKNVPNRERVQALLGSDIEKLSKCV